MEQPANINGEFVRFRPRKQHAVIECMQEPGLADPTLLLDKDTVHDGDLACRSAEAEHRHACPGPKGFAERNLARHVGSGCQACRFCNGIYRHVLAPLAPSMASVEAELGRTSSDGEPASPIQKFKRKHPVPARCLWMAIEPESGLAREDG